MGKRVLFTRGAAALALSVTTMMGCAGIGATAFAVDFTDPESTAQNIYIVGEEQQLANHKVKALKIGNFNAVSNDGSGYDVTSTLTGDAQKTFDDAVKKIDPAAEANAANEHLTLMQYVAKHWTGTADDQYGNKKANNENLRKLADALKGLDAGTDEYDPDIIYKNSIYIPVDFGSKTDDNHGGLYLIIDQAGDLVTGKDSSSNSLTMIVSSQIQANDGSFINTLNGVSLGQVNVKNDIVSVTKTRTGVNNGTDPNDVAGVGDTVHFKLEANVPTFNDWPMVDVKEAGSDGKMDTGDGVTTKKPANAIGPGNDAELGTDDDAPVADGPLYKIIDMNSGFKDIGLGIVKVFANTGKNGAFEPLTAGTDFTVDYDDDDNGVFVVTLKDAYAHRGQKLKVTYDAVVSASAVYYNNTSNTAEVEWSNNPYDVTSTARPRDENTAPLAVIQWNKYNWGTANQHGNTGLNGATFRLVNTADKKVATFDRMPVPVDGGGHGDYETYAFIGWVDADKATEKSDLVTGRYRGPGTGLIVSGLPEGTFNVMETQAPDGYIRGQGAQQLQFDVTIDNVPGKTDVSYKYAKSSVPGAADFVGNGKDGWVVAAPTADNKSTASIYNTRNIGDMPKTGGQFLLVAGIATGFIILGIGGTFVAKRSRRGIAA